MEDDASLDACAKDIKRLEIEIKALRELMNEKFRNNARVSKERRRYENQARKMAVKVLDRHLVELNNAKATMLSFNETYLPRKEYDGKQQLLEQTIDAQRTIILGWTGTMRGIVIMASVVFAVASPLIAWLISGLRQGIR